MLRQSTVASNAGRMVRTVCTALLFVLVLQLSPAFGQQTYIGKYDVFGGFTYLSSNKINLAERGFHMQVGYNQKTWLAMGFDFATASGHTSLLPDVLPTALQQTLAAQLVPLVRAGIIPATYAVTVPIDSTTQTYAAGPQLQFRHWKPVTIFLRPSLGAMHETAIPKPVDAITKGIVAQLSPSGKKQDWTGFYGVGGGVDVNVGKHFAMRFQADYVYDHLFNDLLREGRQTLRLSVGPTIHFGKNIAQ